MGPANNASNGSPHQQQGASLVKGGSSHNPAGTLPAGISTDQVRISQLLAGVVTSLMKTLKYTTPLNLKAKKTSHHSEMTFSSNQEVFKFGARPSDIRNRMFPMPSIDC